MADRKSLKAFNLFVSGWVKTIYHLDISDNENIVMKADVIPSQCVNATLHEPRAALNKKQGTVLCVHCSMLACMASLGETCSHVAGLLFKTEAAVRTKYTKTACADEACQWSINFVKELN